MMAWVWPVLMVRLTPFRISLVPCSVSMLTCRSLISRVDMCLVLLCTAAGAAVRFLVDKFLGVAGCRPGGAGVVLAPTRSAEVRSLGAVQDGADIHIDVVIHDGDGKDGHGIVGRQLERLAAAQVELGAVAPALDLAAFNLTFGERDVRVRAGVADRMDLPHRVLHDRYRVVIDQDAQGLLELDLAGAADQLALWLFRHMSSLFSSAVH